MCVVDDDPDMREALRLVLELRGYSVEEAADGQRALELLRSNPGCCLILLDLMMPGMNGWQFRKAQQEAPELAAIPVVVLSAMRDVCTARGGGRRRGLPLEAPRHGSPDGRSFPLLRRVKAFLSGFAWLHAGARHVLVLTPWGTHFRQRFRYAPAVDRAYVFYELTNSLCSTCLSKVEAKIVFEERQRVHAQALLRCTAPSGC